MLMCNNEVIYLTHGIYVLRDNGRIRDIMVFAQVVRMDSSMLLKDTG